MSGNFVHRKRERQRIVYTPIPQITIVQFLGFTRAFFSKSEWGSTQNVLMIMLHWSKQISRNFTYLLPNERSTHTV